jgi:hypothetical protein
MDATKLKQYAELLEAEIHENLDKSKDVRVLAEYQPLTKALADTRDGLISEPRRLGDWLMSYWLFESNIQSFDKLTERLVEFDSLLQGRILPSERET